MRYLFLILVLAVLWFHYAINIKPTVRPPIPTVPTAELDSIGTRLLDMRIRMAMAYSAKEQKKKDNAELVKVLSRRRVRQAVSCNAIPSVALATGSR